METGFPNFNFNVSHHGDYVAIASEPICLVGVDIVSHSVPVNETADKFIQSFSSYFSELEWRNIRNAGSSDEVLRVFYRYVSLRCLVILLLLPLSWYVTDVIFVPTVILVDDNATKSATFISTLQWH